MVCHKLIQHADGTLTLGAVPAMAAKYTQQQDVKVMASNGYNGGTLSGDDAYVLYNRLGTANHLSFTVKTSNNWDKFGVSFVRSTDNEFYYTMVVNPEDENHRKVNFEQEGYRVSYDEQGNEQRTYDELKDCFNNGPKWPADGHEGVLDSRAFYAGHQRRVCLHPAHLRHSEKLLGHQQLRWQRHR